MPFHSIEGVRVAVIEDDEVVGFIRVVTSKEGVAFVNTVVTYRTWQGFGVGRALMDEARFPDTASSGLSRAVRVARSTTLLATSLSGGDLIEMSLVDDCDHCTMRDERLRRRC